MAYGSSFSQGRQANEEYNSLMAIFASAGITETEANQLGAFQSAVAQMISSGEVTSKQAQHIVQQYINSVPTEVNVYSNGQNSPIPFELLKSKYQSVPNGIQPQIFKNRGGSYFASFTGYQNSYASNLGFQTSIGKFTFPTSIAVSCVNSTQNDFPYASLGITRSGAPTAGNEAGLIYIVNSSGVGYWRPFFYSHLGSSSQYTVQSVSISSSTVPTVLMGIYVDGTYPNCKLRQIVFDASNYNILVDNQYSGYDMSNYSVSANGYAINRSIGMMRTNDSASITGGYFYNAKWAECKVGSLDSNGVALGFGTWDTTRGNGDEIHDGNVPDVVLVTSQVMYSAETVNITY
jgi:hypothetical protein